MQNIKINIFFEKNPRGEFIKILRVWKQVIPS